MIASRPLRIGFDISVLGIGHAKPSARTGIFRFTESVLLELVKRNDVEVVLVAHANLVSSREYLRHDATDSVRRLPFLVDSLGLELLALEKRLAGFPRSALRPFILVARKLRQAWSRRFPPGSDVAWSGIDALIVPHFMHVPSRLHRSFRGEPFLIHYDIIPLLHPEWFSGPETMALREAFTGPAGAWRGISISQATTQDLVEHCGVEPSRLETVHLAADRERFHDAIPSSLRNGVRERFGIGSSRYILALNTVEPRKNLEGAVLAFRELTRRPGFEDVLLVIAGARGWKTESLDQHVREVGDCRERIRFTGYVPDDDLPALLAEATAFVYLSWYEGFGLPPLEAMSCGTPVVCSNRSSLPEVVGDAGFLVAPDDPVATAEALATLLSDPEEHRLRSRAGKARANEFSWSRAADEILGACRRSLRK